MTELLSWRASEFSYRKKNPQWFAALGIISFAFLVVAILLKSVMFGLLVIVAAITLALFANTKPRVLEFTIMTNGIKIHKTIYPYDTIKSFWIFFEPDAFIKELSIESKKLFMPFIKVPLGNTDPNKVRETLLKFLPEKKHPESVGDVIARIIRF